jgi:hypothetical protein
MTTKFKTYIQVTQPGKDIILCVHAGCTYLGGRPAIGEVCVPHLIQ